MSDTPQVCKHGSLRRVCETCDLAEDVVRLERELAEARKDALALAQQIDPFDTDQSTYQLLRKYISELPEQHPMNAARREHGQG